GPNDSLNSIALRFNITPNKLVQLNKLFSRSVYPGQVRSRRRRSSLLPPAASRSLWLFSQKLFVPDANQPEQEHQNPALTNGVADNVSAVRIRPAQTGSDGGSNCKSIRRELSPNSEDESPATVKFIKMSCKYFTDGKGVVGGVLIVTPNNIMFDPHKSDPLVIEHGCEEYGLICPMEEVMSVALYDDVSRMKLKDALPSDLPGDLCPVYRPGEWEQLPSERDLNPFSRYEALNPRRPIVLDGFGTGKDMTYFLWEELEMRDTEDEQEEKSPSDEGFTELEPTVNGSTEEAEGSSSITPKNQPELGPRQHDEESKLDSIKGKLDDEEDEGVAQNSSIEDGESMQSALETEKRGDKPATGELMEPRDTETEGTEELGGGLGHRSSSVSMDLSGEQSLTQASEPHGTSSLKRQSPDRPTSGSPTNMLYSSEEKSKNPPMFLCFKVGKPMRKSFTSGLTSSPIHCFRGRGKQPEYWFAVPQERVDHLYSFFVQWSPDVYGKEAREQGFVVVEKDELDMIDNFFGDPASCSWEIITIDEAKRRQSFGSCDCDLAAEALPMLSDTSDLLQDTDLEKLSCRLPARVQGYPWSLVYSTVKHGTSLKTLYRSLADVDSPVLLVVKDTDNRIFGAFSTHPFRVSEHFYGTGETFLYSFCPEIKTYRWTGENSYFIKGNIDSLQMGGGGGQLGLWLDAELYRGTTTTCATFNNQPLSAQQDFNIHSVEVWTFE
ncbi:unnamed protein product, partial [Tetraodon nigroviridis]